MLPESNIIFSDRSHSLELSVLEWISVQSVRVVGNPAEVVL